MFSNFAWSEMLVIAAVAIIVVGPKELPGMLRTIGKSIGKIKRMAGDFQRQVDDAIKDADLDGIKDMASNKTFAPLEDAKKSMEEFAQTMKDPLEAHKSVVNEELEEIEAPAVAATKSVAKKTTAKKAPAKKTVAKKPAAKATVKKTDTKKAAARTAVKPKSTASDTVNAKAKPAAKPAPRKSAVKKPVAPKSTT